MRTALIVVLSLLVFSLSAGCRVTDEEKAVTTALFDDQTGQRTAADVPVVGHEIISELALPEGYPVEVVPIIKDSKISLSTQNEDEAQNVIYWVAFTSAKSVDEIRTYYRKVFKNAENVQQIDINDEYFISGSAKNQSFTISISSAEIEGQKQSIVSIMVGSKDFLKFK